jgi:hypothetical protein
MRQITKKLAIAATATALIGAIGASVAQTDETAKTDPMATPQEVVIPAHPSGQEIYFFHDQGNAPESDPAAHLMLIKHQQMVPVAETTTTTTVAQATTTDNTADTTTAMPAPADTSNTNTTDTTAAAPVDNTPALAPKADRN